MMQQTTDKKWFDDLIVELRLRQVHGSAIGDTVASARELLGDTGQRAEEAFGPARDYAAALELPSAPKHDWVRKALWPLLLSLLAFLVFSQAAVSWAQSELMLVSLAQAALLLTPVVLVALLPLYLDAVIRRAWVLIALSVICALSGVLAAVLTPATPADAWLAVHPLPWVIGSAVVMVTVSILNTVRSLGSDDDDDDITDPLATKPDGNETSTRTLVLITNWLFPLLALAMLGLALSLN